MTPTKIKNIIVLSKNYPFKHAPFIYSMIINMYLYMYLKPRQTNGIPFHPPTTPTTHRIQIRQQKKEVLFVHSFKFFMLLLKFYVLFFLMFHFYWIYVSSAKQSWDFKFNLIPAQLFPTILKNCNQMKKEQSSQFSVQLKKKIFQFFNQKSIKFLI